MPDRLEQNIEKLAIENANSTHQAYVTEEDLRRRSFKEAYYQWISRLMILLCIVSLAFFTSASLVLFKMAPEVMVEPFLIIRQDHSDSMVRYEVIAQDMASNRQMMEMFIKQYIIMRNAVINDEREMQARWLAGGIVNYLSAPQVYIDFNKSQVGAMSEMIKEGVVRDVEVISVSKVGGEKSPVWKVDFRTYDISRQSEGSDVGRIILTTRYWTASVTAFFVKERMFMAKRLMNPLGFTVVRYSQTEVEIL